MAWERKRGKLEQFNRLIVEGDWTAFSAHIGNYGAFRDVRYVVTVDAGGLNELGDDQLAEVASRALEYRP